MRTFIGVPLPAGREMRNLLREWAGFFARSSIKWADPAHWHLTLAFLGDTTPAQAENIGKELSARWGNLPAFSIRLRGLGLFGGLNRPRVIWIGVDDEEGMLQRLKVDADETASRYGFEPDERPFRPHLTLARPRLIREKNHLRELMEKYHDHDWGDVVVKEVIFFESRLRPEGAVHLPLRKFPFRAG
ncbi:MAG: RNA 2',3'-cyclic phosphodiesterase [Bacteroidales bacterium]